LATSTCGKLVRARRSHGSSALPGLLNERIANRQQLRNRTTRVQNDQDQIFEGLPIRNWRLQESTVGVHSEDQTFIGHSRWPEHAMPRDSHLLSDMSRQLLRIARLPRVSKPPAPVEEEEKEPAEEDEVKEEHKGFSLKRWVQMEKGYDAPDREYLAKRRKGLPPMHDVFVPVFDPLGQAKPMTTLKVRKYDAEGNSHVYEVIAPVGQKIDGEILDDENAATAPVEHPAAPGTVIDGLGVVNQEGIVVAQPIRRKPPIPQKRKKKGGPGRSKKKIVPELGPDGVPIHPPYDASGHLMTDGHGTATEGGENGDTPMPDAGDDDDDDDQGSGEDGEIMEDDDEDHDVDMSQESTPASVSISKDIKPEMRTPDVPTNSTPGPSSLRTEIKLEPEEIAITSDEPPLEPALEPVNTTSLPSAEDSSNTKPNIEDLEPVTLPETLALDTTAPIAVSLLPSDSAVTQIQDLPEPAFQNVTMAEQPLPSPKPTSSPIASAPELQAPEPIHPPDVSTLADLPRPPQTPPPAEPTGPFSPPKEQLNDANEASEILPESINAMTEEDPIEEDAPPIPATDAKPETEPITPSEETAEAEHHLDQADTIEASGSTDIVPEAADLT
jgi:hypothetical protein